MIKLEKNTQIIKTRDDTEPVILEQGNNTSSFKIKEGTRSVHGQNLKMKLAQKNSGNA